MVCVLILSAEACAAQRPWPRTCPVPVIGGCSTCAGLILCPCLTPPNMPFVPRRPMSFMHMCCMSHSVPMSYPSKHACVMVFIVPPQDIGHDPSNPLTRLYATAAAQPYHNDAADVVTLLCLKNAREGGLSSWSSSITGEGGRVRGGGFGVCVLGGGGG
jgi:hypothetical protein